MKKEEERVRKELGGRRRKRIERRVEGKGGRWDVDRRKIKGKKEK